MPSPSQLLFLPGAGGNADFWRPVSRLLRHGAARALLGWPGFGDNPRDPAVNGIDDLVTSVLAKVDRPTALVAQSMGGIIAVRIALARPDLVTHLVLAVTSGGIDLGHLRAQDWRPAFADANPRLPTWFIDDSSDLTPFLDALRMPVLLLWGDADPISPLAVGEKLRSLLPNARLHIIAGGAHNLANRFAQPVAALIDAHLEAPPFP